MEKSEEKPPPKKRRWKRLLIVVGMIFCLPILFVVACNLLILVSTRNAISSDLADVPESDFGLVLGTSNRLSSGRENLHFRYRMNAAAELYNTGKIKHLLVSGANPTKYYNEPKEMKKSLMALGVPGEAITSDYAGRRTLDSMVRAKEIFGLKRCVVVSDPFHVARAVHIARHNDLEAFGYASRQVDLRKGFRSEIREWLARVRAVLDLYVLHTRPEILGEPEPIVLEET